MPSAPPEESAYFAPLSLPWLDRLLVLEQQAHSHPWTRGNFVDALHAGYAIQLLIGAPEDTLIGYFVAMAVPGEVQLLNLVVAPARQRQGWARLLLDALALWARQQQAQWLWLEVRQSNARARSIYAANGFEEAGLRKDYYPAHGAQREHAVIMKRKLWL